MVRPKRCAPHLNKETAMLKKSFAVALVLLSGLAFGKTVKEHRMGVDVEILVNTDDAGDLESALAVDGTTQELKVNAITNRAGGGAVDFPDGLSGDISGDGSGLTDLNADNITSGTLATARGGTGVTTSTGSGSVVLSTSPTLTTPNLGTPTSALLTNATGLPIIGGTTGTLSVARGGTGATSFTVGDFLQGNGTGAIQTVGSNGSGNVVRTSGATFGGTFTGTHSSGSVSGNIVGTGISGSNVTTGTVPTARHATTGTGDTFALSVGPTFTGTTKLTVQHNSSPGNTGCSLGGTVCSGTWQPTRFGGSCAGDAGPWNNVSIWHWSRDGNIVRFNGKVNIDCDSGSNVLVNLPVASNFTTTNDVFGSGLNTSGTEPATFPTADTTNNVIEIILAGNPNNKPYYFDLSYIVK